MPPTSFISAAIPIFLIPCIQLSIPPSLSFYLSYPLHSNLFSLVSVLYFPTEFFFSLLIWLHHVAVSASRKHVFLCTTQKIRRVQPLSLAQVPAPPPSIMSLFVWLLCLFWCIISFDLGGVELHVVASFFLSVFM